MTRIIWDEVGVRRFETGLDRGVLYTATGAVPWNGLTSVNTSQNGVSAVPVYFDDKKINEIVYLGDLVAKVKAYTYPDEFLPYDGFIEAAEGMYLDGQQRDTFGMSYRTLVGDDVDGIDLGYKIHLLYNLTAIPEDVTSQTIEANVAPIEFGWTFTSIPDEVEGFRPTAHMIVDSTKVDPIALSALEDILYGADLSDPRLPSITEVYSLAITVKDNGDGTFTITGPDAFVTSIDANNFELDTDRATSISSSVYEVG